MTITTRASTAGSVAGVGLFDHTHWSGKIFTGEWVSPRGGELEVTDKATGEVISVVGHASPEDVRDATKRAREAQPAWAAMPVEERASILRRAAQLLESHQEMLKGWDIRETGGTPLKVGIEFEGSVGEIHHAAALLTEPAGHVLSPADPDHLWIARRVPVGVVGVIAPWNMPMLLALRSAAPALALGNAVVLKPDPQTPVLGGVVLAQIFAEAGVPAGVFQVMPGGADTGEALVTADEPQLVTFTGSTAVGRRVGELAGSRLKRVSLELGGKSPFIVLDDADIDAASSAGAFGSFFHQGQICMGSGRHIVHRKVADEYVAALSARASALTIGDPFRGEVEIGPMINPRQVARVDRIVRDTVAAGAELAAGGTFEGTFFAPTILTGVGLDSPAYREEIFGPVAPVLIVDSDEEAVRVANDTEYGLSGAVYTSSFERGWKVANQIRSGMVHINDQTIADYPGIPMGGMGASGNGSRFGSTTNWEEFTQWQWLTYRPEPAKYPY